MRKLRKINDSCAIVALYFVSKLSEELVIRVCKSHGFEVGAGMVDEEWMAAARELGVKTRSVSMQPMRLRKFLNTYPRGLYLVATRNHLFAVDGGIVVDPHCPNLPGLDRVITNAWRVLKNKPH